MASLKAGEVDRFLARPDFSIKVFLVYGPDSGLVSERADKLAQASGVDLSDPFNLVRLDADTAAGEPGRIADEINTVGLFGDSRLIRISGTTRRDMIKAIEPALDTSSENAMVIIEAGDLKKSAALRKRIEGSKTALAIPCYLDTVRSIQQLIDEEIRDAGLEINRECRQVLVGMLGSDRKVTRNELSKLATYCMDKKEVSLEDIQDILGDTSALAVNEIADSVSIGDLPEMQKMFSKAVDAGTPPDIILLGVLKHFQQLQLLRHSYDQGGQSAASLTDRARPPIHFSRKDRVARSIEYWSNDRIPKALTRLDTAMLECRVDPMAGQVIAKHTLLAIGAEARRRSRVSR